MTTSEVASFGEMPLDEKLEIFYCRTGNHVLFQLFHLRHRLPGSAARIIAQNFASCRLASSFTDTFFLVFNLPTSSLMDWPGQTWAAAYTFYEYQNRPKSE
jgi:hypothetical protein